MTTRDRLMLIAIVTIGVLAAGYLLVVSPERNKASKLSAEVAAAQQQLESARTAANEAGNARSRYAAAYASLVSLGPAVPATSETPALVYALDAATKSKNVEFNSITSSGTGGSSPSSPSPSSSATSAAAGAATFTQMPFGFVFNGSFEDLYGLFSQLEGFTTQTASGGLRVNGRLLTIDGIQLSAAQSAGGSGSAAAASSKDLAVSVTATAYVLPSGAPTASTATPASPSASPAAAPSAGGSSPTSAAVVKAGP